MMLAIPSVLALACAGGMMAVAMKSKHDAPENAPFEWRHFVTPQMSRKAESDTGRTAPSYKVKDALGQTIVIGGTGLSKPQFVYFVNTECPCSYAAEPMFHALRDQFATKIDFICVTNGDASATKRWVNEMDVPYPAVPDKKADIMRAYHAPSSVYAALVTTQGRIVKMWPGFSKGYLLDMNHEMAAALGEAERPFDTQYAPTTPATGCAF